MLWGWNLNGDLDGGERELEVCDLCMWCICSDAKVGETRNPAWFSG